MSSDRIYPELQNQIFRISDRNEPPVPMPRRTSLPCRKLKSEKKFWESMQTFTQPIRSGDELPSNEHTPPPTYEHSMTLFRNSTSPNQSSYYPKYTEPETEPTVTSKPDPTLKKLVDSTKPSQMLSNGDIKNAVAKKVNEKSGWSKEPLQRFAVVNSEDSVSYRVTVYTKTVKRELIFEDEPMNERFQRMETTNAPPIWHMDNDFHKLAVSNDGRFVLSKNKTSGKDQVDKQSYYKYGKQHQCSDCSGRGFLKCYRCKETGIKLCSKCNGKRTIKIDGNIVCECDKCNGKGDYKCTPCYGTGKTNCKRCDCQGQVFIYPKLKVTLSLNKDCRGVLDENVTSIESSKLVDKIPEGECVYDKSKNRSIDLSKIDQLIKKLKSRANEEKEFDVHKLSQLTDVIDRIIQAKRDGVKKFNQIYEAEKRICWQRLIVERIPTCEVQYNIGKGKSHWLTIYGEDKQVHCNEKTQWPKKLFGIWGK